MLEKEDLEILTALYLLCKGIPDNSIRNFSNIAELTSINTDEVFKRLEKLRQKRLVEFKTLKNGSTVVDIALIKLTEKGLDYVENPFEIKEKSLEQINNQIIGNITTGDIMIGDSNIINSPIGNVDAKNFSQQTINILPEQISEINKDIDSISSMIKKSNEIPDVLKEELSRILNESKKMLENKNNSSFLNKLKEFFSKLLNFGKTIEKIINLWSIFKEVISLISKIILI